ncbi:MAG: protein kinase [Planctomycetes bacterium]|nr:protein kinase [Planctomycetota bacterium]
MQIGRYLLEAELGRGGMGVVYRARDPAGRPVALKVLAAAAGEAQVLRFQREGEVAARLRHPGIVTVHEAFVHEGRPVLVQELVGGPPLHVAWRGRPRAARVDLVRQVAHAVAHAHARGVVHRDLKAENVVIDEGGAPKVIDFGLATASDLERLTRTGALVGTPTAMAPEQLGDRDALGPWTDVWALGVLLHEALLDRPPFEATDLAALLAQVAAAEVAPPRRRDPSVSPALEAVCLRCLARAPSARYPDAGALARDLDRVARRAARRARPGRAPPVLGALGWPPRSRSCWRWPRRWRRVRPLRRRRRADARRRRSGRARTLEVTRGRGGAPGDLLALGAALVDAPAPALRAEGRAWLERAAAAGEVEAMVLLGRALLAAAPDDAASVEAALAWLDRAGQAGRADAWWHAGRHFESPRAGRTREEVYADAAAARDAAAALRWWGRAAEAGHARAMRKLGEVHEDGWCVAFDEREAARWYGRAAEAGDARAMYLLANVLEFFDGPLRDRAKAAAWHARALEALPAQAVDDPDAAASLGMHLMGSGARVKAPDPDAAIPWLRRALAGGAPEATVTLGSALLLRPEQQERPGEAVALLERGVPMWRGLGAVHLGQAYERGAGGLAADRSLARAWYERAVARGRREARLHLGELLLGDPDPAVRQAGLDHLREVAGAADLEWGQWPLLAARRLVEALRAGDAVPADAQEALRWAVVAARSSAPDLEAARTLVVSLAADPATATTLEAVSAGGEAVADHLLALLAEVAAPPRHDEAAARYTRALERGHAPSRWHRALALRRAGRHEAAAPDLRALADEGSARAMRTLGEALAAGEGLERDDPQAASWLLRAHQAGDRRAAVSLAELVAAGRGVERDDRAALALLERVRARLVQEGAETHAVLRRAARLAVDLARTLDDPAAVTRWLKVGASVDEPACMAEWARRLETGDGVAADAEEAARLRARLAELGQ